MIGCAPEVPAAAPGCIRQVRFGGRLLDLPKNRRFAQDRIRRLGDKPMMDASDSEHLEPPEPLMD
jgi:hypothetical protein